VTGLQLKSDQRSRTGSQPVDAVIACWGSLHAAVVPSTLRHSDFSDARGWLL